MNHTRRLTLKFKLTLGPKSALQNRLLFHLSHKLSDENRLKQLHSTLGESVEDQLSLASIHYLRNHYQEAIDIYKRLLINNREYHALNVYIALCYYKLDYYDVSEEVLSSYLSQHADSATAINLKACNLFKIFNGKAAEIELKTLEDLSTPSFTYAKDLVKHNLTVFRNGQGCLQVLPSQVDVIPEARLNLVIYYLKQDELTEAEELMKDVEASTSQEYILKAIVHACIGQQNNSKENITKALQLFNVVGSSSSECDTIPGRQCMASTFLLRKQFEEAMVYLNSIKSYFHNNDTFNFNYGQAKASLSQFKEAEEAFLLIQSDKIKAEYTYLSWLTRCFIMNKKPRLAWELYLKMDTCTDSYNLLLLIANDCYKIGLFFYSAKAFDVLERLDSNPEFWEGKRGACMGAFQLIVSGQEPKESLRDIGQMLQNTGNPQVEYILRIMNKWAKENRLPFYN